jgi:hypothetical protein
MIMKFYIYTQKPRVHVDLSSIQRQPYQAGRFRGSVSLTAKKRQENAPKVFFGKVLLIASI